MDSSVTRASLIGRLKDWEDQVSWQQFYDRYWRLIYGTARHAGLSDADAQEVLQETVLSAAKELKKFQYDRAKGRFKAWLLLVTRRRIADQFRKLSQAPNRSLAADDAGTARLLERIPDPAGSELESVWEQEWQRNLLELALERLKSDVNPKQYQIFHGYVIAGQPVRDVAQKAGVSQPQVYWVKHQFSRLLQAKIKILEQTLY